MKSAGASAATCSSPLINADTNNLSNIGISPNKTVNTSQRHLYSLIFFICTSRLLIVSELAVAENWILNIDPF